MFCSPRMLYNCQKYNVSELFSQALRVRISGFVCKSGCIVASMNSLRRMQVVYPYEGKCIYNDCDLKVSVLLKRNA